MPWPSTIDNIEKMSTEKLPEELERFLNLIFSGNKPNTEKCERKKRFVYSIGQDVCRGISSTMETQQAHSYLRHLETSLSAYNNFE